MTNWLPNIKDNPSPIYIALADEIESAIKSGTLPKGEKLPPQRNIAYDLGVTIGTVSRAYSLAHKRGLVSGEVGRGTYVLDGGSAKVSSDWDLMTWKSTPDEDATPLPIDMAHTTGIDVGQSKYIGEATQTVIQQNPQKVIDYIRVIPNAWRTSGQKWLASANWMPEEKNIAVCSGIDMALTGIVTTLTDIGDKVAMEGLTYGSFANTVKLLGRRVLEVEMDEGGLIPESFEKLCAQQHPKILYTMPTIHNPTLIKLSYDRRKQIAEIAHRYNVWIIEDMAYGSLVEDDIPPIAHFAPELTYYASSLSKSFGAGLRMGWVACPPRYADRLQTTLKILSGGGSFLLHQTASLLVESGIAFSIKKKIQTECEKRIELASQILDEYDFFSHPHCPYMWLKLPEPWGSDTFKSAMLNHNILIGEENNFKLDRNQKRYHCVRFGLSIAKSCEELEAPMKTIRQVLESGISGYEIQP